MVSQCESVAQRLEGPLADCLKGRDERILINGVVNGIWLGSGWLALANCPSTAHPMVFIDLHRG